MKISPQAQVITTLIFTFAVASFGKGSVEALPLFFVYPAALLLMCENIKRTAISVLKKLLIASPFVLTLGLFGSLSAFYSLLLRFALTVSAMLILVEMISFSGFCSALERLRMPKIMITQLILMHRYSFLLRDEVRRLRCAHALRSGGNVAITLSVFGSIAGNLLLRTFDRADIIHQAMLCRGFDGTLPSEKSPWRTTDIAYILVWSAIFIILRFL